MPIKVPDRSPAEAALQQEGVEVIPDATALRQDIRPLRILLLNLMPTKIATEVQIARLLSHTPLQIELSLLTTATYQPRNTPFEHLKAFYRTLDEVKDERFDGMIVTGAPVETLPFEKVDYWTELKEILAWSRTNVFRRFGICWGGQALLYAAYGVEKIQYPEKLFGVFEQRVQAPRSELMRGFPDSFPTPVSRWTGVDPRGIAAKPELRVLADSPQTGIGLVEHVPTGDVFCFNHLEYDTETLRNEFTRDVSLNPTTALPHNYFPGNSAAADPANTWRAYGYLMFMNWITTLYRDTLYDLSALSPRPENDWGAGI
ncbi:homoserine O-succinyltransferase [Labrys miyagiensis]|uniref:Homoserine O-acetyltransferase n=1 Tax=Labrys miyagiensis TaxID=346912 RepID=A0ABQ6CV76_9HYPH|nr:homoserine O-succinyltransferase [Labrys miyagiensis]GLS22161.1 homoserine O-succinyltransferase [Labrys miyagiensis]